MVRLGKPSRIIRGRSVRRLPVAALVRADALDAALRFHFSYLLLDSPLCNAYAERKVCDGDCRIISPRGVQGQRKPWSLGQGGACPAPDFVYQYPYIRTN